MKTRYKCRPASLRTKTVCEEKSLTLSCPPPLKLAIAASKFTISPSSLVYCPTKYAHTNESPCKDLLVTSQVSALCHGQQVCSFLVDPVSLALLTGVKVIKPAVACHKNYSALRITSACVDKMIFLPEFVNNTSTSTLRTTTTTLKSYQTTTFSTFYHYLLTTPSHLKNSEHGNNNQSIEAKPLEPKPTTIDVKRKDFSTNLGLNILVSEVNKL